MTRRCHIWKYVEYRLLYTLFSLDAEVGLEPLWSGKPFDAKFMTKYGVISKEFKNTETIRFGHVRTKDSRDDYTSTSLAGAHRSDDASARGTF